MDAQVLPPSTQRAVRLLQLRIDRTLTRLENEQLRTIEASIRRSMRNIATELRRRWPDASEITSKSQAWAEARATAMIQEMRGVLEGMGADMRLDDEFLAKAGLLGAEEARTLLNTFEQGLGDQLLDTGTRVNFDAAIQAARNMSGRLYRYSEEFVQKAQESITESILRGEGVAKATRRLRQSTGLLRYNAERIVRTEAHQATDEALRASYEQVGVEYGQRIAVMDSRVCEFCAERSGKVYPLSELRASLHPFDRCYILPWKPEWVDSGVIDEDWVKKHRAETIERLRKEGKEPIDAPAPFERGSRAQPMPQAIWGPGTGFTDYGRERLFPAAMPPVAAAFDAASLAESISDDLMRYTQNSQPYNNMAAQRGLSREEIRQRIIDRNPSLFGGDLSNDDWARNRLEEGVNNLLERLGTLIRINEAALQSPLPQQELFRGILVRSADLPQDVRKLVGTVVEGTNTQGLISASKDRSISEIFAKGKHLSSVEAGHDTALLFRIRPAPGARGLDVGSVSAFPDQAEVILPIGTRFRIVDVIKREDRFYEVVVDLVQDQVLDIVASP